MRSAERDGKIRVFFYVTEWPLNVCHAPSEGGVRDMIQTRNAAKPLSYICLIPLVVIHVLKRSLPLSDAGSRKAGT